MILIGDVIDITKNDGLEKMLEMFRGEMEREKVMVEVPGMMKKVEKIVDDLKYLLNQKSFEYVIELETIEMFPSDITINLKTVSFGCGSNDYELFKNIINSVDSFDSSGCLDGEVNYYFEIKDVFKEVPRIRVVK